MSIRTKFFRNRIIISICILILNLVFINYLPNNLASQINTAGHFTSYTSKYVFIIIFPILNVITSIYLYFKNEFRIWRYLMFYALFIFCNISIIVVNLIYR